MSINNRLFLRNMPYSITEKELRDQFKQFGTITNCVVKNDRGIAFITFQDSDSYKNCLAMDNKILMQGRLIGICPALRSNYEDSSSEYFNTKQDFTNYDTIFISNIPLDVEDYELREVFMKYRPHDVKLTDGEDHKVQCALIRILNPQLVDKAIQEMNGYILKGSKITVSLAEYSLY